jgi:hypothetical protein
MSKKATLTSLQGNRETKNEVIKKIVHLSKKNPNLSYQAIGDVVGRDKSTVWRALKRYGIEKQRTERFKADRSDILAGTQEKLIEIINNDPEKIAKASLRDIGIVYGILDDKERLSRGQATSNVAISAVIELVDKRLKEKQSENA